MRLATFQQQGRERFGLVLRHPREAADWIFDPTAVERAARTLSTAKGGGYTWWRPDFRREGDWPHELVALLREGEAALAALRRMQDFLSVYLERGDPAVFAAAGWPVSAVELQAPIPAPRILLGVVGNNAGFLRMDPARGRNLQQPSCHQRTQTSVIGPGQPFVLPESDGAWAGTTELGLIIGRSGRDIPRDRARDYIAGYTVINDAITFAPTDRTLAVERAANPGAEPRWSFHAANSASWLGKKADTMLAMGPWLVTPEEVGDPYDLLCFYREEGSTRNRGHSSALVCGIEELIHWLSSFMELAPGMVLHLGAMGQDGLLTSSGKKFGPGHLVEAEIERIGTLRNPLVAPAHHDWRAADDVGRAVHAVPLVRKIVASAPDPATPWSPLHARHFWTATLSTDSSAPVHPFLYNHPPTALSSSGSTVRLPPRARTITARCELAVIVGKQARQLRAEEVPDHLLGAAVLLSLRDSSFADQLVAPQILSANMPELYARWPDGFNVLSAPVAFEDLRQRSMTVAFGTERITRSTDLLPFDFATVVAELSAFVTLLPGDVISLGSADQFLTLPPAGQLPAGAEVVAAIAGLGEARAHFDDQRSPSPP